MFVALRVPPTDTPMAKRKSSQAKVPVNAVPTGIQNPFADIPIRGLAQSGAEGDASADVPAARRSAVVRRETAHRAGRTMVVVGDIAPKLAQRELEELSSALRKACGCGGTLRGGEIEIQGEQVPRVREFLEQRGFRVRGVR